MYQVFVFLHDFAIFANCRMFLFQRKKLFSVSLQFQWKVFVYFYSTSERNHSYLLKCIAFAPMNKILGNVLWKFCSVDGTMEQYNSIRSKVDSMLSHSNSIDSLNARVISNVFQVYLFSPHFCFASFEQANWMKRVHCFWSHNFLCGCCQVSGCMKRLLLYKAVNRRSTICQTRRKTKYNIKHARIDRVFVLHFLSCWVTFTKFRIFPALMEIKWCLITPPRCAYTQW